jgi:hypothetical protein
MNKILVFTVLAIGFLFIGCNNSSNEINSNLLNEYANDELEFSINYPLDWHITDLKKWTGENNSISGVTDLTIANAVKTQTNSEGPWWDGLPEDYKAIGVRIYDRGWPLYQSEYLEREREAKDNAEKVVEINVRGNQAVVVYIDTERNPEPDSSWDSIYPDATAFYKGYNYAYVFTIIDFSHPSEKGAPERDELISFLKDILETFKDISDKSL